MNWIEQSPHANVKNGTPIHILVSDDEYVAFISVEVDGFRAMVPYNKMTHHKHKPYHYTHDTLQDAKDWCIAELWKRRLEQ